MHPTALRLLRRGTAYLTERDVASKRAPCEGRPPAGYRPGPPNRRQGPGACGACLAAAIVALVGCSSAGSRLHQAAAAGSLDQVQRDVDRGANVNLDQGKLGTPLHQAAVNDRVEVARWLLEHGARVDSRARGGSTPLWEAARCGYQQMTELLLRHGADPRLAPPSGLTALHITLYTRGSDGIVQPLLAAGAEVNATAANGLTPLHIAALGRSAAPTEVVRIFLSAGANPNAGFRRGWTPLHLAAERGDLEVGRLLLGAGANPNAITTAGFTPLSSAAQSSVRPSEMTAALLAAGARPVPIEPLPAVTGSTFWAVAAYAEAQGQMSEAGEAYDQAAHYFEKAAVASRNEGRRATRSGVFEILGTIVSFAGGTYAIAANDPGLFAQTVSSDVQSLMQHQDYFGQAKSARDDSQTYAGLAHDCRKHAERVRGPKS